MCRPAGPAGHSGLCSAAYRLLAALPNAMAEPGRSGLAVEPAMLQFGEVDRSGQLRAIQATFAGELPLREYQVGWRQEWI